MTFDLTRKIEIFFFFTEYGNTLYFLQPGKGGKLEQGVICDHKITKIVFKIDQNLAYYFHFLSKGAQNTNHTPNVIVRHSK